MGLAAELAAVLETYLDQAAELEGQCQDFRWGDRCDHAQVLRTPSIDPVMYELGPLVSVVYEATKGGELYHWEHDFKAPLPVLAYGSSQSLWILGGGYSVTHRGIVG